MSNNPNVAESTHSKEDGAAFYTSAYTKRLLDAIDHPQQQPATDKKLSSELQHFKETTVILFSILILLQVISLTLIFWLVIKLPQ